jgi:hypothetical protein
MGLQRSMSDVVDRMMRSATATAPLDHRLIAAIRLRCHSIPLVCWWPVEVALVTAGRLLLTKRQHACGLRAYDAASVLRCDMLAESTFLQ